MDTWLVNSAIGRKSQNAKIEKAKNNSTFTTIDVLIPGDPTKIEKNKYRDNLHISL